MTITTAEELNALPHSAIIVDNRDYAWQKLAVQTDELPEVEALWGAFGSKTAYATRRVAQFGPFEVLSDRALTTLGKLTDVAVVGA